MPPARRESTRATGFQVAQLSVATNIRASREQLGDREYLVLLEVVAKFVDDERQRVAAALSARTLQLVRLDDDERLA